MSHPNSLHKAKLLQDMIVPAQDLALNGKWFFDKMHELIGEKSYMVYDKALKNVDVVKDVLRLIPVHWAAQVVCFSCFVVVAHLISFTDHFFVGGSY